MSGASRFFNAKKGVKHTWNANTNGLKALIAAFSAFPAAQNCQQDLFWAKRQQRQKHPQKSGKRQRNPHANGRNNKRGICQ